MCEDDDNFLCGVILDFGIFSLSDLMGVEILRAVVILEDQFLGGSGQIRYYGNVSPRLEVENEDLEVIQNRLRNLQDQQFRYVPQLRIWYVTNPLMVLIGKHPRGYGDGPSYQGRYTGYGDRRIGVRRSPVVGTVNKVGSDGTGASSSKVRKTLLFEEPAPTIQIVTTDQDIVAVEDTSAMQEIPVVQKQGEVEEETKLPEERSLY
ncbi:hypothetical protein DY000_02022453 [Brassica cretica]|uniref:DUF4283 domain-containing protein n=1 Tax=Brassica cretica TaxID=69181 RepID=A0ABQ7E7Y8_BRACR|nr:hypothetical protein DY000_02022453 [Brassica cretica]